ncbi:DUF6371 domain-containing protein [Nibrella saemangeumensis]|uniref:DUF6371 domain-containing protein n=1 Tax=Nibrella saemangeumensis TaxID=1084526 RepID=A0ABP8MGL7_9BACT
MSNKKDYRYQFEKKGSQHNCPECGEKKEYTRYVDTYTGELLPEEYGRCNQEDKCGYFISPYHKDSSGTSYSDRVWAKSQIPSRFFAKAYGLKDEGYNYDDTLHLLKKYDELSFSQAVDVVDYVYKIGKGSLKVYEEPSSPSTQLTIPEEVYRQTLKSYFRNNFALLLNHLFGDEKKMELIERFQVGTLDEWPKSDERGGTIFWIIDEHENVRGGQLKLFSRDGHTKENSWIHTSLIHQYTKRLKLIPNWLYEYAHENDNKWPVPFGLHQLATEPHDKPVAIVEACKTAVICTGYLPEYIWMAVGGLSFLNAERLTPLKHRDITLFPDASKGGSTFRKWSQKAEELNKLGFRVTVDNRVEKQATYDQKVQGCDLADLLIGPKPIKLW